MKPAFLLFVFAPLVGEYLLGNLTLAEFAIFPVMALMYGAGAIVIREVTRRVGRGWPTLLVLALAYGVLEEGIGTQSLFNPHFFGLRLLDYGFVPSLGIGVPWTIYVLMIHLVWSISVPIVVVEALFEERGPRPWLGKIGLTVYTLLFVLGMTAVRVFSSRKEQFNASSAQTIWTVVTIVALIVIAFALVPRRAETNSGARPADPTAGSRDAWTLGIVAFGSASAIQLFNFYATHLLPALPSVAVALILAVCLGVGVIAGLIGRKSGWRLEYTNALGFGALFVYCWFGFFLVGHTHGVSALPGQVVPLVLVLGVVGRYFFRKRTNVTAS